MFFFSYLDLVDTRVSFLLDVEAYRRATDSLQQHGTDIYARYIASSAPIQLQISTGTQLQVCLRGGKKRKKSPLSLILFFYRLN